MKYKIGYICEALIDQNRYIGSTLVGHCCSHQATHKVDYDKDHNWIVCDRCRVMLLEEPDRITLSYPKTDEQRTEWYNNALKMIGL
jgi:hypothetical protein